MNGQTQTMVSRSAKLWASSAILRRWVIFYSVGALGIVVQLSTLGILTWGLGLHYLLGTGLAVWIAILHNFMWHEHWTWSERARIDKSGRWKRLARFQLSSGALSIMGNLVFMQLFVGYLGMSCMPARLLSIAACSILNFYASDRWAFSVEPPASETVGLSMAPAVISARGRNY